MTFSSKPLGINNGNVDTGPVIISAIVIDIFKNEQQINSHRTLSRLLKEKIQDLGL